MAVPTEWDKWQPGKVAYRYVQAGTSSVFTVERKGPDGTVSAVVVYDNQFSAGIVRDILNQQRAKEIL